jgi:hypothetical protein
MVHYLVTIVLLAFVLGSARADDETHMYQAGEEVVLWTNKIGPYHNPQETYAYYSLPFCHPTVLKPLKRKVQAHLFSFFFSLFV